MTPLKQVLRVYMNHVITRNAVWLSKNVPIFAQNHTELGPSAWALLDLFGGAEAPPKCSQAPQKI